MDYLHHLTVEEGVTNWKLKASPIDMSWSGSKRTGCEITLRNSDKLSICSGLMYRRSSDALIIVTEQSLLAARYLLRWQCHNIHNNVGSFDTSRSFTLKARIITVAAAAAAAAEAKTLPRAQAGSEREESVIFCNSPPACINFY